MRIQKQVKKYLKNFNNKFFLKQRLEEDYEKGIKEIKEASKIKNFVFFIFGVIVTCAIQFLIYRIHPSNFTGKKLEKYLINEICEECNITQKERVRLQNVSMANNGILVEDNTLFITGKYEEQYTFVAIFGKGDRRFFDFIFSTNPEYELIKIFYSEDVSDYELYFSAFKSVDLDADGKDEVVINLDSEYASYAPRYTLVFKGQENKWDLLEPDLSILEHTVLNINEEYDVILKKNIMYDKDKKSITIYGLYNYGELMFYTNIFYNYYNFCYCIPIIKPEQSMPEIDTFAYLMLRIDTGTNELVIERNWNQGGVMISPYLTDDDIYNSMGFRTDSHIFYDPIPQ